MRKLLMITSAILGLGCLYPTTISAQTCTAAPSCADMGYTKTIDDCTGKNTLKCPFDLTKVSCEEESISPFMDWKYTITCGDLASVLESGTYYYTAPFDGCFSNNRTSSGSITIKKPDGTIFLNSVAYGSNILCLRKGYQFGVPNKGACIFFANRDIYKPKEECEVGDYYYSDDTCAETVSLNKTKLGVVIDKENKLVADFTLIKTYWEKSGTDISSITNYTSTPQNDMNGLENTANGFAALGNYAFKSCYETKTTGGKQWYLPAAGELYKLASNESLNTMLISGINFSVYNSNNEKLPVIFQTSTEYDKTYTWAYNPHNKKLVKVSKGNNSSNFSTVHVTTVCMFSYKD